MTGGSINVVLIYHRVQRFVQLSSIAIVAQTQFSYYISDFLFRILTTTAASFLTYSPRGRKDMIGRAEEESAEVFEEEWRLVLLYPVLYSIYHIQ